MASANRGKLSTLGNIDEQYKDIISRCLDEPLRPNRTGNDTRGYCGEMMVHTFEGDDSNGYSFPLLTTKNVPLRAVAEELFWFLSGKTDSKILEEKKVNIWKGNTSEEFLASRMLSYREGDAGPIYGFQWRHRGAAYIGADADYTGKGIDQISELLKSLSEDPYSRRHVVDAWNPEQTAIMSLPPCHYTFQIVVEPPAALPILTTSEPTPVSAQSNRKRASLRFTMRSTDVGLGLPFNIASYALLLVMICRHMNFIPHKLIAQLTDVHVYAKHIDEGIKTLVDRSSLPLPIIKIPKKNLLKYSWEDIELVGYKPHEPLRLTMVV